MIRIFFYVFFVVSFFTATLSLATTKGLSQIVTPDLQKPGDLGLTVQMQSAAIGNPFQLQAELGLNSYVEVSAFQGFNPGEGILATEIGLFQHDPYLLSAGFLNYSTRGGSPQPFLEAGYYNEHDKWMIGPIYTVQTELVLGWAHDFNFNWRLQFDFQSGSENFSTIGFTYTLNDQFLFNPSLFFSNSNADVSAYFAVTYSFSAWSNK